MSYFYFLLFLSLPWLFPIAVQAEQIIPAADGTGTTVKSEDDRFDITGGKLSGDGANLFHSFSQFGISETQIANFLTNPNIRNILTRVVGGNVSSINGLISVSGGNSNLFLMNPAGIVFGQGARLDVPGSFLATTASGIGFGDRWFNATGVNDYSTLVGTPNSFNFGSQTGVIVNAGNLAVSEGQSLSLLGGVAINTGQLSAPGGAITIAAVPGENLVRISQAGHLLSLEIATGASFNAIALPQLIAGVGESHATGITVNNDGKVQLTNSATTIPLSPGTTIASGSIDVSSPFLSGGRVAILGDRVGLISANINASGTNGGNVFIGGDFQGKGNFNAAETSIDSNSNIAANGISSLLPSSFFPLPSSFNNGGRVVVWANGRTNFLGNIAARGGILGGDGGFVEVSGKNSLSFAGKVDTRAPNGAIGTLLLDPSDIIIEAGSESSQTNIFTANRRAAQFGSNPTILSESQLESIAADSNIIVETTNSIVLNNLPDDVLTLQSGKGNSITFRTDGVFVAIDANDLIQTQGGDINISAASISVGRLDANGGNITLRGNGIDFRGGDSSTRSIGGTIRLETLSSRDINLGGTADILGVLDLTPRDLGAIADGFSAIAIGGSDGRGAITVVNPVTFNDPVTLQGGAIVVNGEVTGRGDAAIALNALSSTLNANITTSGGSITFGGNVLLGDDVALSTQGQGNIILPGRVDGSHELAIEALRLQLGGGVGESIPLTSLNVNAENAEVAGNITAGSITFNSAVAIARNVSLRASDDITFTNTFDTKGDANNLEIKAGGDIAFEDAVGNSGRLGAIALESGGNVTANSTIAAGSLQVNANDKATFGGNVAVSGGNILIEAGSVVSQGLNASGVRGGNIEVRSSGEIVTGNINVSGTEGSGGNIFLNAQDNINIGAIDAQGGSNGNGGTVAIATSGLFRASDTFRDLEGIESSISTVGGEGGGAIAIRHGGGNEQSFIVGNATTNGTRGAINTGINNVILPDRSFEGTYRQGNSPNQISLITTGNSPSPTPNPTPSPAPNPTPSPTPNPTPSPTPNPIPSPTPNPIPSPTPNPIPSPTPNPIPSPAPNPIPSPAPNPIPSPTPNPTPSPTPNPTPSPTPNPIPSPAPSPIPFTTTSEVSIVTSLQGETRSPQRSSEREYGPKPDIPIPNLAINVDLTGVLAFEENFTQEYEKYLQLPAREPVSNMSVVYDTLRKNEAETGIKSAIIYMNWIRGSGSSTVRENSSSLKINPERANQLSLKTENDTDRLELVLVNPSGQTIRALVPGVTRLQLLQVAQNFQSDITNPQLRNTAVYLEPAQQLYRWLMAPLEADLKALNVQNLIIIPSSGLRSIPFAALHNGQQFLIENYSISIMPSFSLTDTRYEDISDQEVLGMGASIFTDKPPLPAVPVELSAIASPEQGKSFLNQDFTLANLQAQRAAQSFGIIHLATHSEFQPGVPSNSYIQLWDTKLRLDQMRQLKWNDPPVNLLVLSACSTALGDEQAELGFAGLAVASGARSALASLWEVSDEGTLGLMVEFYQQLRSRGENNRPIIKAQALRQAQLAMLRGQVRLENGALRVAGREDLISLPAPIAARGNRLLSHPYYWAAFTMIGNPW
jgi:filamentous hemagglutinin family protein